MSVRELAKHLSDNEARRGVLRYADDLDSEVAELEARIAAKKTDRTAIDVI